MLTYTWLLLSVADHQDSYCPCICLQARQHPAVPRQQDQVPTHTQDCSSISTRVPHSVQGNKANSGHVLSSSTVVVAAAAAGSVRSIGSSSSCGLQYCCATAWQQLSCRLVANLLLLCHEGCEQQQIASGSFHPGTVVAASSF